MRKRNMTVERCINSEDTTISNADMESVRKMIRRYEEYGICDMKSSVEEAIRGGTHIHFALAYLGILNQSCEKNNFRKCLISLLEECNIPEGEFKKFTFLKETYWDDLEVIMTVQESEIKTILETPQDYGQMVYGKQGVGRWIDAKDTHVPSRGVICQIGLCLGLERDKLDELLMSAGYTSLYPIDICDSIVIEETSREDITKNVRDLKCDNKSNWIDRLCKAHERIREELTKYHSKYKKPQNKNKTEILKDELLLINHQIKQYLSKNYTDAFVSIITEMFEKEGQNDLGIDRSFHYAYEKRTIEYLADIEAYEKNIRMYSIDDLEQMVFSPYGMSDKASKEDDRIKIYNNLLRSRKEAQKKYNGNKYDIIMNFLFSRYCHIWHEINNIDLDENPCTIEEQYNNIVDLVIKKSNKMTREIDNSNTSENVRFDMKRDLESFYSEVGVASVKDLIQMINKMKLDASLRYLRNHIDELGNIYCEDGERNILKNKTIRNLLSFFEFLEKAIKTTPDYHVMKFNDIFDNAPLDYLKEIKVSAMAKCMAIWDKYDKMLDEFYKVSRRKRIKINRFENIEKLFDELEIICTLNKKEKQLFEKCVKSTARNFLNQFRVEVIDGVISEIFKDRDKMRSVFNGYVSGIIDGVSTQKKYDKMVDGFIEMDKRNDSPSKKGGTRDDKAERIAEIVREAQEKSIKSVLIYLKNKADAFKNIYNSGDQLNIDVLLALVESIYDDEKTDYDVNIARKKNYTTVKQICVGRPKNKKYIEDFSKGNKYKLMKYITAIGKEDKIWEYYYKIGHIGKESYDEILKILEGLDNGEYVTMISNTSLSKNDILYTYALMYRNALIERLKNGNYKVTFEDDQSIEMRIKKGFPFMKLMKEICAEIQLVHWMKARVDKRDPDKIAEIEEHFKLLYDYRNIDDEARPNKKDYLKENGIVIKAIGGDGYYYPNKKRYILDGAREHEWDFDSVASELPYHNSVWLVGDPIKDTIIIWKKGKRSRIMRLGDSIKNEG